MKNFTKGKNFHWIKSFGLTILLISCSYSGIQLRGEKLNKTVPYDRVYSCLDATKAFFSASTTVVTRAQEVIQAIRTKKGNLSFSEEFVIFSLIEASLNPHNLSPYANISLHVRRGNRLAQYESHYQKGSSFSPLLSVLKKIHSESYRTLSFRELIQALEQNFSDHIKVNSDLADYLEKSAEKLTASNPNSFYFFKDGEIVQENDQLKRGSWLSIPYDDKYVSIKNERSDQTMQCNFDLKKYENSEFPPNTPDYQSHSLGMRRNTDFYWLNTWQENDVNAELRNKFFFKNKIENFVLPYCFFKNASGDDILLFSLSSRDPAQLLAHFIAYAPEKTKSLEELYKYIYFPRHQILPYPVRVLYESHRGDAEDIKKINDFAVPIYHKDSLGVLNGIYLTSKSHFILDDRSPFQVHCKE